VSRRREANGEGGGITKHGGPFGSDRYCFSAVAKNAIAADVASRIAAKRLRWCERAECMTASAMIDHDDRGRQLTGVAVTKSMSGS
jgi:hypothetical protein